MSDDQDGCEWVSVSSGTGLPGFTVIACTASQLMRCQNSVRLFSAEIDSRSRQRHDCRVRLYRRSCSKHRNVAAWKRVLPWLGPASVVN